VSPERENGVIGLARVKLDDRVDLVAVRTEFVDDRLVDALVG
jgi:hypothetical protein